MSARCCFSSIMEAIIHQGLASARRSYRSWSADPAPPSPSRKRSSPMGFSPVRLSIPRCRRARRACVSSSAPHLPPFPHRLRVPKGCSTRGVPDARGSRQANRLTGIMVELSGHKPRGGALRVGGQYVSTTSCDDLPYFCKINSNLKTFNCIYLICLNTTSALP